MLHFITLGIFKDNTVTYNLMLECAGYLTKNKRKISRNFKHLNLPILARYCIDDSNEIMSSACNLMISSILNKDERTEDM